MKKLVIALGLLLVFTMTATAQEEGVGVTAKGFKAGLNLANISGDDAEGSSTLMGFAFGGFMTYNFSPNMAIQPEILYTMKGFSVDAIIMEIDTKFNYLEIPVLLKFTFGENSTKPFFMVGPAFSILMSADVEGLDVKDALKSTDLGIVAGAGAGFPMGSGTMSVEGRYTMGMSSVDDTGLDIDWKNSVISVMVGYGF